MESALKPCLCSLALIALDLLLDFVEDARPELSNVSANEYPVSTKAGPGARWAVCVVVLSIKLPLGVGPARSTCIPASQCIRQESRGYPLLEVRRRQLP